MTLQQLLLRQHFIVKKDLSGGTKPFFKGKMCHDLVRALIEHCGTPVRQCLVLVPCSALTVLHRATNTLLSTGSLELQLTA